MKDLGLDMQQDDNDLQYEVDEPFYSEEIKGAVKMNTHDVRMGQLVKKEVSDFDRIMSECEGLLQRKTMLLKL